MKKRPLLIAILLLVSIIGLLTYMFLNPRPNEYYIFQNIEECEDLIPHNQSGINIDRYDTPTADKDLKGLTYCNFFGMSFESDTLKYKIFAYEFENSDSALKYYVNVTGQKSYEKNLPLNEEEDNKLLLASQGMSTYTVVVISKNKAYKLIAPNQYVDEISKLLAETFSQKIS